MKPKPDLVKLELVLTFEDWLRLRSSSAEMLRQKDTQAIVNGVFNAVHMQYPKVYLCLTCKDYVNKQDLRRVYDRDVCPRCNQFIEETDLVTNLHNLS